MKKISLLIVVLYLLFSCKGACVIKVTFANKSSENIILSVNTIDSSLKKTFNIKRGESVVFTQYNEEAVPPYPLFFMDSYNIKLENGKSIEESCVGNNEERLKCQFNEHSMLVWNSYISDNMRGSCDGLKYIFTDVDATKAR